MINIGMMTTISMAANRMFGPLTYKVSVEIYEERSNATVTYKDRARRVTIDGIERYHLLKRNRFIPPPKFSNLFIGDKGRTLLKLAQPQSGQYIPLRYNAKKGELEAEEADTRFWFIQEQKEQSTQLKRHIDWAAISPYVALTIFMLIVFVELMVFFGGMGGVTAGIIEGTDVLTKMSNALGKMKGLGGLW